MTLPLSGQLTLQEIAAEFGGSVPHNLSEYYSAATGVPHSGPLAISDFYGLSSIVYGQMQFVSGTKEDSISEYYGYNSISIPQTPNHYLSTPFGSASNVEFNGQTVIALVSRTSGDSKTGISSSLDLIVPGNKANVQWFSSFTIQNVTLPWRQGHYRSTENHTLWRYGASDGLSGNIMGFVGSNRTVTFS